MHKLSTDLSKHTEVVELIVPRGVVFFHKRGQAKVY